MNSFFKERGTAVSTVRAGNVIGGGDFAPERILPDCVRAAEAGKRILVRNPHSIRPYQHVLEPVNTYLMIAGELVTLFCRKWKEETVEFSAAYLGGGDVRECMERQIEMFYHKNTNVNTNIQTLSDEQWSTLIQFFENRAKNLEPNSEAYDSCIQMSQDAKRKDASALKQRIQLVGKVVFKAILGESVSGVVKHLLELIIKA